MTQRKRAAERSTWNVGVGRVAFGHRRLAVTDLSPAGAQPVVDDVLGLTVVFNG